MTQHPSNRARAHRAESALRAAEYWDHNEPYAVTDMLSDLRHLCDKRGWDFDALNATALAHYSAEAAGDIGG